MKDQERKQKTTVFKEGEWYKEKIFEMVSKINDVWILKTIYNFVVGMTKEGN